jgi:hypothetical protein
MMDSYIPPFSIIIHYIRYNGYMLLQAVDPSSNPITLTDTVSVAVFWGVVF